jgi:hypothetical protein
MEMANTAFDTALIERSDLTQYGTNARTLLALEIRAAVEDIHTVAASALTDGFDDKKCDLVYISRDDGLIIVAQGYEGDPTKKKAAPANKASDLNTAAGWLLSRHLDELPERIKSAAQEVRLALDSGEIRAVHFWYVHNLPESTNVQEELKTVEETVRSAIVRFFPKAEVDEISAIELGQERLNELYRALESPILVDDEFEIKVPGGYEIQGTEWNAFVTSIPAQWLRDLHRKYKSNLFSANVRDYLGSRRSDRNINNGIKQTAQRQPQDFWAFNNGITALVHSMDYQEHDGKLTITGLSIVNGAQTTGALGTLPHSPSIEAMVPARFVRCNDRTTITNIIRYNNSQNSIKPADFRSNDAIQRRLRDEFTQIPQSAYTGGRRGSPDAIIRRNPDLLPAETCAQALLAFHQDPVTAYNRKSQIWESDTLYSRCFNEQTTATHIIFAYSLVRAIEAVKLNLTTQFKNDGTLPEDRNDQLFFLNKRGSIFLMTAAASKCLEIFLGRSLPNKFRISFSQKTSPAAASQHWSPIIDTIIPFAPQLRPAVDTSLSLESARGVLETFTQLVRATSAGNAATYRNFADKVVIE